ncbi:MAG: protoheme IX farnesyltransferase [Nitrospirae bacterium]|nr:protoheme IX farnesyltransferase [Nitrospirota bacterium]
MKEYVIESAIPASHAIGDYLVLAKPGIVSLVMMSTLTGLCIASRGLPDIWITISVMTGIALATAGSAILNNYVDRDIDAIMERTRSRALAVEAFSPGKTVITGILLVVFSVLFLSANVNLMTATLTGAAVFGYVVLYTIILKRRSSYANQIGGIAGALPPVIGYVAVTQRIDLTAVILFAISAIWQHPHALSIALKYRDQYESARIPVIPVAKGVRSTKIRIFIYTALLLVVSITPYISGMTGWIYLIIAIVAGIYYLGIAVKFMMSKRDCDMFLFFFSILYILVIFTAMILDMA